MRLRQRRQSAADRRRQFLFRRRGTGAEPHHAAGEGKQILDAMVHLSEEQSLPLLGTPAASDVAGDLGCANDLAFRVPERRDREGNVNMGPILALQGDRVNELVTRS
jgi:hypothetical protein